MKENPLFIYENKDTREIKVRDLSDSEMLWNSDQWDHIGTIDPVVYIQSLLREYQALVRELKGESA